MKSPIAALAWEIWRREQRSAWLGLICLSFGVLVNLATPESLRATEVGQALFPPLFGLLMVLSFLLVMGVFNYTESTSTKEWNGFPYRLFALPVRTWQLVFLPMVLGVVFVELLYAAWMKLVWTHGHVPMTGWFAVLLGVYMVCYQSALWSLAGLRITRILVLSIGGTSIFAVACLPFVAGRPPAPWFSEERLIPIMLGLALVAAGIAWATVARQRCGGGRRHKRFKTLLDRVSDALPRRTKAFASPAAAQYWLEWRRSGLLLPSCIALALIAFVAPLSWLARTDAHYTTYLLVRLLFLPVLLAFVIGKGFIKPDLWSTDLSMPSFLATRPFPSGEFVKTKLRVAAASVALCWVLVLSFVALWLWLWGDTSQLKQFQLELRRFYPHSWHAILGLSMAGLTVISWRCLVSGLWSGLSGSRLHYIGSLCLQVGLPAVLLLALGIWWETINAQLRNHPDVLKAVALSAIGWILGVMVAFKLCLAVFAWSKMKPSRTWPYLLGWSGVTLCFVTLAILARPAADVHHLGRLYIFAALLLVPLARVGLAPWFLAKNRHR